MQAKNSLLLIDNFDSFTYNLLHLLEKIDAFEIEVIRNNELDRVDAQKYQAIVISPGPGIPNEAGFLMQFIAKHKNSIPILGICLGHQALIEAFGGTLTNLTQPYHGIKTLIQTNQKDLFYQLPEKFHVGRYHSWVADRVTFPAELEITAIDESKNIMAFSHKSKPIWGLQFHPESILSDFGEEIVNNWLVQLTQLRSQSNV
jgi:anthranilate synthase component 2